MFVDGVLLLLMFLITAPLIGGDERDDACRVRIVERESYNSHSRCFAHKDITICCVSRYYHEVDPRDNDDQVRVINFIAAFDNYEPSRPEIVYAEVVYKNGHTEEIVPLSEFPLAIQLAKYSPDGPEAVMVSRNFRVIAMLGKNDAGGFDMTVNRALREKIIALHPDLEEFVPEDRNVKDKAEGPGGRSGTPGDTSEKPVDGVGASRDPKSIPRVDGRREEYKHGTPRELLESVHKATLNGEFKAITAMFHPAVRKILQPVLDIVATRYEVEAELGRLVREKVDKDRGEGILERAREPFERPLSGAIEHGEIQWDRVNIEIHGDKATVMIKGEADGTVLTNVDGKWYVHLPYELEDVKADLDELRESTIKQTEAMKRLIKGVRNDWITTEEEFRREQERAMRKAFGLPLFAPAKASRPRVHRTLKDLTSDLEEMQAVP